MPKEKSKIYDFLVVGGGILLIKNLTKPAAPAPETEQKTDLPPVDSSVVVNLKPRADRKAVTLSVSNIPAGTQSIEYEVSYLTGEGLPKGSLGQIKLDGKTAIEREILLGTCSKNTCTYDSGVTKVKLVLRFNSAKGASQFNREYPLE